MKLHLPLFLVLIGLILSSSCKVTKRLYNKGYHIESYSSNERPKKDFKREEERVVNDTIIIHKTFPSGNNHINREDDDLFASAEINLNKNSTIKLNKTNECDILILSDGSEIKVKVIEITESNVKYKKCNYLEGPNFVKSLKEVHLIKFSNGENFIPKIYEEEEEPASYREKESSQSNFDGGASIAGLVFSIIAAVFSVIAWFFSWIFTIPGLVMGLLAIIFGAIGSKKTKLRGMGVYSLVMGIITFILALIALVIILLIF